jgi:sugar-specific transcriptional regulator TrmB
MNIETSLQEIGLTQNEVKTYLALTKIGTSTTAPLIKATNINSSKIYESLDKLLEKGLVSYSKIKNKKNWQVEDFKRLLELMEEEKEKISKKEEEIKQLLPKLEEIKNKQKEVSNYRVFEGTKGIKTAREEALNTLNTGDTFYLILSTFPKNNLLSAYFKDFQERRAKKGIKLKVIYNSLFEKDGEYRKKLPHSEVRFLDPENLTPTWTEIYGDSVAIGVATNQPSLFVIQNKDISKGYIEMFNNLWMKSKK